MSVFQKTSLGVLLCAFLASPVLAADFEPNYDESKVGNITLPKALPDNLGKTEGRALWEGGRRAEVLRLFQENVYGKPVQLGKVTALQVSKKHPLPDGQGFWQTVRLNMGGQTATLLLRLPEREKPVPVFLGYNFCGNHASMHNPALLISEGWANPQVCGDKIDATSVTTANGRFTPASRAIRAYRWPEHLVLEQGFGLVTLYYGDVLADNPEAFQAWMAQQRPNENPGDYSAIGIWAAGLSSVMDYLETRKDIDKDKVIVFGHSRLGKTALWAGANDPRFAMVISNNSGEGGAALARRNYGETLASISRDFPHWFNKKYASFGEDTNALPVDQHLLIALSAPRPVYVASAENDQWADPKGEFLSTHHAKEVYRLYTDDLFSEDQPPAIDHPLHSRLNYHDRKGGHDVFAYDWLAFIRAAKKELK